ncbi:ABC transporter permease [Acidicapsa acidisoli]|uniref:ABC transporter permease n=1 Tax=Acidicapsa acidisoli TaxID=1615681 RepID=UPI0021E05B70|nr:ABC transporter permease [Acidicapsa acidisoli]
MNRLLQDLRYALRQLRKSPGFTITAVITLALGIGANAAIFTLVQGILLKSLPVSDPKQLYRIGDTDDCCVNGGFVGDNGDFDIYSYDLYLHLKSSAPEFEQLAAMQAGRNIYSVRRGNSTSKALVGEYVSGNYFTTLGVGPYLGRTLLESDDTPAANATAVLSYQAWQSEFAGDPSIVGSTITIQAHPFSVIGVAPRGFFGDRITDNPPALWLPLSTEPLVSGPGAILHHPDSNWLYPIGRVRPGTVIVPLQQKLSAALRQWLTTRPAYTDNGGSAEIPKQHVTIVPGGGGIQSLQQETGTGLKMLMILSTVVLLIACANIANLLLARATARRTEITIRMALGSGRSRLIRQIFTESVLLSCIGGLAGLAVAYAGSHLILTLAFPDAKNLPIEASPSPMVLGFAFLISLITGLLFGTAPAWLSSHAQPAEALRGSNRSTSDRSSLPQKTLVVFQAALSLVLLVGAVLMTKSLTNLEHQDFGIATTNRYVLHLDPSGAGYTIDRLPALYREMESRFSALPGISGVGLALYSPLEGDNWGECVIQQGHPAPRPGERCGSTWDRVNAGYLKTIGVPMVRGREFTEQDTASSQPVAIVNQTFVNRFYPNQDPVGKHFGIDFVPYSGSWEIVGVFKDFKMNNPREKVRPVYLRPLTQQLTAYKEPGMIGGEVQSMFIDSIVLRFDRPQEDVESIVRKTLAAIDPNLTVIDLRSLDAQVAGNFNQDRLIARLTTLFGVLALILASVGLYGVTSYFVARRTGEIGIRMALGATRPGVVSLVLRSVLVQIGMGLALGIPSALAAGYFMKSQLYGVSSYDPIALTAATILLALCAITAGFIPARRAASIEPMKALRIE